MPKFGQLIHAVRGDTYQALVQYDFKCNYLAPPQMDPTNKPMQLNPSKLVGHVACTSVQCSITANT